jgi:hypothetical protein
MTPPKGCPFAAGYNITLSKNNLISFGKKQQIYEVFMNTGTEVSK